MTIGERIRRLRGSESRELFARRFGKSRNTILYYEQGKRKPDATFLAVLCRACDVSPAWLLLGEGEKAQAPATGVKPPFILRGRSIVKVKLPVMFLVDLTADQGGELTTMDIIRREVARQNGGECPAELEITEILP